MNGFIKLHRKLVEWEWYSDSATKDVFLHLLLSANFKPTSWKGIEIKPGQVVIGRKKLSEELGLSERQVRTALNHLKSTNEVAIETTNRFSVVTVVNWEKYQIESSDDDKQTDQQNANDRPTSDQQTTSKRPQRKNVKKDKNVKKERNIIPPPRSLLKEYITKNHFQVDADRFYDFYESKGWLIGKQRMKDWQAAVRTWSRKENHGDKPDAEPKNGNRQGDYDYSGFFVNGGDF
ncbi:hypothetical protein LI171_04865 [Emergencia timonensis]|uniref:hypothetical protein n=1 Tax=Emergencia timonensis TaxID=1776384 RepID=UPI001D080E99|nr:hypothetical protein [Emergencia timonensis]MCB6475569.1 hypothetical protein [Emergencia timonensis]